MSGKLAPPAAPAETDPATAGECREDDRTPRGARIRDGWAGGFGRTRPRESRRRVPLRSAALRKRRARRRSFHFVSRGG